MDSTSKNKIFKKKTFKKVGSLSLQYNYIVLYPSPIFFKEKKLERFDQFSTMKYDFENQNFEMFEEVVCNIGKSDGDIIY